MVITDANFQEVLGGALPLVLDFSATWCGPCKKIAPIIEELAEEGVEISAENPIYLDLPYPENRETYVNKANAMKQSVEAATDGMIEVTLVPCSNDDEWYYTGYYTSYGYEANFDIFDLSGWGPDYGDPQTFLDTMLPDYAGYCVKSLGIF